MTNYTVKNLKQVENMAEKFGMGDGLEARFAAGSLELSNLGLSYQRLEPNFRIPFGHKHGEQEEVYVLLSGSARLKLDDEIVELKQWDAIRVPGDGRRGTSKAVPRAPSYSRSAHLSRRTPRCSRGGGATSSSGAARRSPLRLRAQSERSRRTSARPVR